MTPPPIPEGFTLNTGDLPASWIGHCDECVNPIIERSITARAFNWLCYRLVLASPWMLWPLLPYAGSHAYQCQCGNRRKAIAYRLSGVEG